MLFNWFMKISTKDKNKSVDNEKLRPMGRFGKSRPSKEIIFDYKDTATLSRFISEHGKIVPRRVSRLNAHQQRTLTREIKRARHLALMSPIERV